MNLRFILIAYFLLLFVNAANAVTTCEQLKSKPDAWVSEKTDSLIRSAKAAFERDNAKQAYNSILDEIAGTIRRCNLSHDVTFAGRYREFVDYIDAIYIERQPDHELGFVVPDKQYFQETRSLVEIPGFLLNQGFLKDVSRYETLDRAKSFLRQLNSTRGSTDQLLFFSYKSRHLGTPDNDNSFRRLLIVVPGDAARGVPEKWVQFGITDPGARIRIRNVSVVSAVVAADGTFNTYFKDFFRTYKRDGSIDLKGRWELGYGDDNSAECHKSGVLPIFPDTGSVRKAELPMVEAVNERFQTYGSPRFDKYLDETKFGPGLSSVKSQDRSSRFGGKFAGTSVAQSMSCSSCHSPDGLGSFNWPMDQTIISSFIDGGQMPFGHPLKTAERKDLYNKLIEEYFSIDATHPGILKSWLMGKLR